MTTYVTEIRMSEDVEKWLSERGQHFPDTRECCCIYCNEYKRMLGFLDKPALATQGE